MHRNTHEIPRVDLPAAEQDNYFEYVLERIEAELERRQSDKAIFEVQGEVTDSNDGPIVKVFGIEISAFNREEEVALFKQLGERGYKVQLSGRPGKTTIPPLYYFLVERVLVEAAPQE